MAKKDKVGPPTALNPAPKPGKKPAPGKPGRKPATPNSAYSPSRVKKAPPKPGKKPGYGTDNMPSATEVVKSLIGSRGKPKAADKGQQIVEYDVKSMPATPAKSAPKKKADSGGSSKAKTEKKAATKKSETLKKSAGKKSSKRSFWDGPSKSEAKRIEKRFGRKNDR